MQFLNSILVFLKHHWQKSAIIVVVVAIAAFLARSTILKPPPQYKTATAEVKDLTSTLEVSGEIKADQKAVLKFQTTGKLGWIGVKTGDQVNKWQPVASLDKSILKKNLKKALNDYMSKRWDFEQIREDNLVTSDNYDDYSFSNAIQRAIEQEQFSLNNQVLDVEIQDLTNKLATLVSPIQGIVVDIDTPVAGVNVALTDAITIVDPNSLYFEAEIDETDIGSVALGQEAEITLESFPNNPIKSEVVWLDFAASTSDSGATVFLAKLKLPLEEKTKFRLGMTGEAIISLSRKPQVLSVPFEAIHQEGDRTFVRVKTASAIKEKNVTLGIETDDDVQIIEGLSEGDQVITGEKD